MLEPYIDPQATKPHLKSVAIGATALALIIAAIGIGFRVRDSAALQSDAAQAARIPIVSVIDLKRGPARPHEIMLPVSLQAYNSAPIYARTNGYVQRWLVDIGDNVRAGQTLAVIDSPDVAQQLAQAKADYQTALANRALAQSTAARWQAMLQRDAVSRQEADEKSGDLRAKSAIADAQRANVNRLHVQQGFAQVRAPFAGTITSRSAQIGALITAGTDTAQPLFTVSDVHRIRILLHVPQSLSSQFHSGLRGDMSLPEYPQRHFDAVVTRSAQAVDPQSGSVLVELQAENADRALKPGAFAQVKFSLLDSAGQGHEILIPSRALIFKGNGLMAAVVDAQRHVHLKPIKVGTDDGKMVVVLDGLKGDEHVIDTPPDALAEGDLVQIVTAALDTTKVGQHVAH